MRSARFGQFSHLWTDMAQRLGLDVQVIEADWGGAAPEERIAEALAADTEHRIQAVMIVHNELNELMLIGALAGVEMALRGAGCRVVPGSGVGAAEEYWAQ